MKLLKPVDPTLISWRDASKYEPILKAMKELAHDMALPVECADLKEASTLQSFLFQRNRQDHRFSVRRRKTTLYIMHANGDGK